MQNRSGGSFEGARVNSFGRVVRVGRSGRSFEGARVNSFGWVVRAGRSRAPVGELVSGGSFGRGPYQKC
jgi:hypothetical protein